MYNNYPVSGGLRLFLLTIDWLSLVLLSELAIVLLVRYWRQGKSKKSTHDLGFFFLFTGSFLMWLALLGGDYYSGIGWNITWYTGIMISMRVLVNSIGYYTFSIAVLLHVLFIEMDRKYAVRKYFFTMLYSILIISCTIVFFTKIEISWVILVLSIGFMIFFHGIYSMKISKALEDHGFLRMVMPFLLLVSSFLTTRDFFFNITGEPGRLIVSSIMLGSIIGCYVFFLKLPPIPEIDWMESVQAVYLLDKAGMCLFEKNYRTATTGYSSHLITSAMSSVNTVIRELTGGDVGTNDRIGISVIRKENKTITSYIGKLVDGVVVSSGDFKGIKNALQDLVIKVESMFANVLPTWDGDSKIFSPVESH
ncbi:hypothetical protein GF325_16690, partial [Candidatus Bathyarchaeota archaeon]|nr:hypothetical protein [Candidatus Bathyarchaeota archaeon]